MTPSRRAAIATIVHDESFFLPIFVGYYSQFFGPDDIYVLDHDSTDGSTKRDDIVRIPVSHDTVDHVWMRDELQGLQHELLRRYKAVIVVDVDELVVPDPRVGSLGDYLDTFTSDFVNCHGVEIVHEKDQEPAYDPSRPILQQRQYWKRNAWYDKPALACAPMEWIPGFHTRPDSRTNHDDNLYLVHLHRMDYDACLERHRRRRRVQWNKRDFDEGWATYNRIIDEEEFDRWFYYDLVTAGTPRFELEPIPGHWKRAF
jgi:hypothetical protein